MIAGSATKYVSEAFNQLIGKASAFLQVRKPEELDVPPGINERSFQEDRKRKVLCQPRQARRMFQVQSVNLLLITVQRKRFTNQVGGELRRIYDRYVTEVVDVVKSVQLL